MTKCISCLLYYFSGMYCFSEDYLLSHLSVCFQSWSKCVSLHAVFVFVESWKQFPSARTGTAVSPRSNVGNYLLFNNQAEPQALRGEQCVTVAHRTGKRFSYSSFMLTRLDFALSHSNCDTLLSNRKQRFICSHSYDEHISLSGWAAY